jgi:hypothetical protein
VTWQVSGVFDQIGQRAAVGAGASICSKFANEMICLVEEFTAWRVSDFAKLRA